jgi:predicted amidohydrolase
MSRITRILSTCTIWFGFLQPYDIILANGRVIDPETKLDAVRNIGIKDGKSPAALKGQVVVDATGLVVRRPLSH